MSISTTAEIPLETPPSNSITSSPLTPPPTEEKQARRVQAILEEIRRLQEISKDPWHTFSLEKSEYEDLRRLLRTDTALRPWVERKLRYDYFPSAELFVLRMPSGLHEVVTSRLVGEIKRQLESIASSKSTSAGFARKINHEGSAVIKFKDSDYGRHDPDASFRHEDASFPGVVLEVCYTQKWKDLSRLADDYILGSDRNVRAVVGLNLGYRSKEATISIWCPQIQANDDGGQELVAQKIVVDQVIRYVDGSPNFDPKAGLSLHLEDFAPETVVEKYKGLRETLFISAKNICNYIEKAEERELKVGKGNGLSNPLPQGVKKRRRSSSEEEKLDPKREKRFKQDEQRVLDRTALDDPLYDTDEDKR